MRYYINNMINQMPMYVRMTKVHGVFSNCYCKVSSPNGRVRDSSSPNATVHSNFIAICNKGSVGS